MDRIETPSYLAGRPAFREYLDSNPWIAKRKKVLLFLRKAIKPFSSMTNIDYRNYC